MTMPEEQLTLGEHLRKVRTDKGLSLRDVERLSGVNSGYLSQLERNEIANPGPTTLNKVAAAYGEPFGVLMMWAGYIEQGLSPNTQRALHLLGEEFTDEELSVVKAVLDAIRSRGRATFSEPHRTDNVLSLEDKRLIRANAVALLHETGDANSPGPVDLDAAYQAASLVRAGAIELTLKEKRSLRRRFGGLVDAALRIIQGVVHLDSREVYVQPELHELKQRFVLAHEAGHAVLPDHRIVFAHLDDQTRLTPDLNDLLERQANQFAIELLSKGDLLLKEFDDSSPRCSAIGELADKYSVSRQATARRVAEDSQQEIAVALGFRAFSGQGPLMSPKVYCSRSFEQRMRWRSGRLPRDQVRDAIHAVALGQQPTPIGTTDARGAQTTLVVGGMDAVYSVIVLFCCEPRKPSLLRGVSPLRKRA